MKVAAIYARSSLGKGKQGETIEHQIEMIQEFSKRTNIEAHFDNRYIYEDEGESGFKTTLLQRPSMRRLLDDIDQGLIDIVFFKGISRFARDSGETITAAKRLKNKGVRVISLEENYDSFRDEPTMFQIYAVMAEQESRKTSIRVSLGNKQKARNGLWSGSITPFGYEKVKDIKNEEVKNKLILQGKHLHSLHPNEHSVVVKKIFEMYVNENLGRKKIVSWLNDNGIKTIKGSLFEEKNIIDILNNEVYIGNIVYGKTRYEYIEDELQNRKIQKTIKVDEKDWIRATDSHLPIISKELFKQAQIKIREQSTKFNGGKRFNAAKHPLTGLIKCGKCDAPMICQKRSNKKKDGTKLEYRYYVCSTYHKKGRAICDQANVNADQLEELVYNRTKKVMIQKLSDIKIKQKTTQKNNLVDEMVNNIKLMDANIQKKVSASMTLLESREFYDTETFIQLNKELQEEIKLLRNRKEELSSKLETFDTEETIDKFEDLIEEFEKIDLGDIAKLRKSLHKTIEKVVVKDNKLMSIDLIL